MTDEILTERAGAIVRVTLNRPEKHNALSRGTLDALRELFELHREDYTLKCAVLTGAGERSFAAGGDLVDLAQVRSEDEARAMSAQGMATLQAIREFPVPVVALLNGDARGGGAELALACDFRVAAATAHIGFIQGHLNISTAWGGGTDLVSLLGPQRALAVLCRSELLSAHDAHAAGLVDMVAGASELGEVLDTFLQPLLGQKPQVLRAFKALANAGRAGQSHSALQAEETSGLVTTWTHADHWEAADGALASKTRGARSDDRNQT